MMFSASYARAYEVKGNSTYYFARQAIFAVVGIAFMAALLRADGETVFEETVFEDRFRHTAQFQKMGARIVLSGKRAFVRGVPALSGARLQAGDLRGGAALVVAALSAEGKSVISGVKHIRRGYDHLEDHLQKLGACMIIRMASWAISPNG